MLTINPQQNMPATGRPFTEFRSLWKAAPLILIGDLLAHGLIIAIWRLFWGTLDARISLVAKGWELVFPPVSSLFF